MCINPIQLKKNPMGVKVPCGRCSKCRGRRVSAWSFRLMQEDKISSSAQFLTLTYDTKNVPITPSGYMGLSKRDLQLFFKRLRKAATKAGKGSNTIRYYAAGEYGGRTSRPHYHIILFNSASLDLQRAWGLGQIHYGNVAAASIGYTLKYISKQSKIPQHKNDDRQKEFSLMSKGIGKNYLDPERGIVSWHLADVGGRAYVNTGDGNKASMPRYYKDKIYSVEQRKDVAESGVRRNVAKLERASRTDIHPFRYRPEQLKQEMKLIIKSTKDTL